MNLSKKSPVVETIKYASLQGEDNIQFDRRPSNTCKMRDCTLKCKHISFSGTLINPLDFLAPEVKLGLISNLQLPGAALLFLTEKEILKKHVQGKSGWKVFK